MTESRTELMQAIDKIMVGATFSPDAIEGSAR